MSKITTKVTKEVEEVTGYACDICNNTIDLDMFYKDIKLNTLTYTVPSGGWGEASSYIEQHICSKKCLIEALKQVPYDATLHLSNESIQELIREDNKLNAECVINPDYPTKSGKDIVDIVNEKYKERYER